MDVHEAGLAKTKTETKEFVNPSFTTITSHGCARGLTGQDQDRDQGVCQSILYYYY